MDTDRHGYQLVKGGRAAVAIVVAPGDWGAEVLLVRRATVDGDPWSGHIALPGGGFEVEDLSLEATARRETLEETGIDLSSSECVGALRVVAPTSVNRPRITVAPFVFRYTGDKRILLSEELAEAWWIPLAELERPDSWRPSTVTVGDGSTIHVRGFQIHGYTLWGLTERILDQFLNSPR